jgi:hypothetical protein
MISRACPWPDFGNITISGLNRTRAITDPEPARLRGRADRRYLAPASRPQHPTPPDTGLRTVATSAAQFRLDNLNLQASYRHDLITTARSKAESGVASKVLITNNIYIPHLTARTSARKARSTSNRAACRRTSPV